MAISFPFSTNIVGVSHNNADGSSRQVAIKRLFMGEAVKLKDASSAEFPEAIGVYNDIGEQLGFLSKTTAQQMRDQHIDFESLQCLVKSTGRSTYSNQYGATIVIGRTRESALSLFDDQDRRIIEGPNYKPSSNATSIYTPPDHYKFDFRQPEPEKKIPWGFIIPAVIGLILAFVLVRALHL